MPERLSCGAIINIGIYSRSDSEAEIVKNMPLTLAEILNMYDTLTVPVDKYRVENVPKTAVQFSDALFDAFSVLYDDLETFFGHLCVKKRLSQNQEDAPVAQKSSVMIPRYSESADKIDFNEPEVQMAIKRLSDCLAEDSLKKLSLLSGKETLSEKELAVFIGVHLVEKLSGSAYTNGSTAGRKCPCGCEARLKAGDMWIGEGDTWHGELDLLTGDKATNISVKRPDKNDESEADDGDGEQNDPNHDSPGNGTDVETVLESFSRQRRFYQIMAQAFVFGWTVYNRHKDLHPYIPTVMFVGDSFVVVIYNPKKDEIYTVGYIRLTSVHPYKSIFWLWIVLNNRLFFAKEWNITDSVKSGFFSTLPKESYQNLKHYYSKEPETDESDKFHKQPGLFRSLVM